MCRIFFAPSQPKDHKTSTNWNENKIFFLIVALYIFVCHFYNTCYEVGYWI